MFLLRASKMKYKKHGILIIKNRKLNTDCQVENNKNSLRTTINLYLI